MNATSMMYFIGAWVALALYGALLIAAVCWFADCLPTRLDDDRPTRYRVTLLDHLRRYSFVRLANRKYALYAADHAATRFLRRLSQRRLVSQDDPDRWLRLIAYLDDFRCLRRDRPLAGLLWCLMYGDAEMQRIAVWLLGKSSDHGAVPALLRLTRHPLPEVRKEVARGLRRLNAWAELRTVAQRGTDPHVLRFTTQPPPKPFQTRLDQFLGHGARLA